MLPEDQWLQTLAQLPQVQIVTRVLAQLRVAGLVNPCVAGGFTRALALGSIPHDIDIHYVGTVPTATARSWLDAIIQTQKLTDDWDIWNFTEHDPTIISVADGYMINFISTIDCLYLTAAGDICDLTGRGVADADQRVLAFTHLLLPTYQWTPGQMCYHLLEGCRRIFLHQLMPTAASARALTMNTHLWEAATATEREYLRHRIRAKLSVTALHQARPIYARYGWDMVFAAESR